MKRQATPSVEKPGDATRTGCALRDFFIADSGNKMLLAYQELCAVHPELPVEESADTIEFAFNRLFVGPKAPVAPPFASVYLEENELVMGRTTLDARDLYASLGLSSPWQGEFPDDHISLEIDACLHLRQLMSQAKDNTITEFYQQFLQEHLLEWAPVFNHRITSAEGVPATIEAVTGLMMTWLQQELTSTMPKGDQE
jgi:putative dimethyl sulfoxide reductase chaperone